MAPVDTSIVPKVLSMEMFAPVIAEPTAILPYLAWTLTLAVPPLTAPEILTAVSMLEPLRFLASPMKAMGCVFVPLLLTVPEKFSAFKPALLDAAVVPLIESLLLVPVTLMVPPKAMPSELLLEPSKVMSPLAASV
jgi:hypothetical protein